jgi:hypothetical protein
MVVHWEGASVTPTFSIAICHAAHRPERVASLARLVAGLGGHPYAVDSTPGHARAWIDAQWDTALAYPGTHMVLLNDDMVPCESFIDTLTAAVASKPGEILCLTQHHAQAAEKADRENRRWLISVDMLVGQAYVVPRQVLVDARAFADKCLVSEHRDLDVNDEMYLSEEHILVVYAACHDRRIWHTVPALVQQGDEPSLCGHDGDWARKCAVPPRSPMPKDWDTDGLMIPSSVPHALRHMLFSMKPERWREFQVIERYFNFLREAPPALV